MEILGPGNNYLCTRKYRKNCPNACAQCHRWVNKGNIEAGSGDGRLDINSIIQVF